MSISFTPNLHSCCQQRNTEAWNQLKMAQQENTEQMTRTRSRKDEQVHERRQGLEIAVIKRRTSLSRAGVCFIHTVFLTFASSLHLAGIGQCVWQQIWQTAVQVDRCQAALEALFRMHQLWQVLIHLFGHTSHIQITCRDRKYYALAEDVFSSQLSREHVM